MLPLLGELSAKPTEGAAAKRRCEIAPLPRRAGGE
jgi:hypothetical protein